MLSLLFYHVTLYIFMSDKTLCDSCNLRVNAIIKTTFRSKTPKAFNDFLAFINSEGGEGGLVKTTFRLVHATVAAVQLT